MAGPGRAARGSGGFADRLLSRRGAAAPELQPRAVLPRFPLLRSRLPPSRLAPSVESRPPRRAPPTPAPRGPLATPGK